MCLSTRASPWAPTKASARTTPPSAASHFTREPVSCVEEVFCSLYQFTFQAHWPKWSARSSARRARKSRATSASCASATLTRAAINPRLTAPNAWTRPVWSLSYLDSSSTLRFANFLYPTNPCWLAGIYVAQNQIWHHQFTSGTMNMMNMMLMMMMTVVNWVRCIMFHAWLRTYVYYVIHLLGTIVVWMTRKSIPCNDTQYRPRENFELFLGQTVVITSSDVVFCIVTFSNVVMSAERLDLVLPRATFQAGHINKEFRRGIPGESMKY